jgi:foldase protein PrsA
MDNIETEVSKRFIKIKLNKKLAWILAAVIIIAVLVGLAVYFKSVFVAAMVNNRPISRLAVIKELEKQGGKNVLDTMIDNRLIQDEAKAKNITVTDDDVNKEIATYETRVQAQGSTLDQALTQAGLTRADLKERVLVQLRLEKLLGDQINVSDLEVDQYIKDNSVPIAEGQEAATKDQVRMQLKQNKLNSTAPAYINNLRTAAKIKTFVTY